MGEAEVDPEIIRKTQESLGKIVKKPPLTEKLLRRPPFKFILDVVKVVSIVKLWKIFKFNFLLIYNIVKLSIQPNCFLVVIYLFWQ